VAKLPVFLAPVRSVARWRNSARISDARPRLRPLSKPGSGRSKRHRICGNECAPARERHRRRELLQTAEKRMSSVPEGQGGGSDSTELAEVQAWRRGALARNRRPRDICFEACMNGNLLKQAAPGNVSIQRGLGLLGRRADEQSPNGKMDKTWRAVIFREPPVQHRIWPSSQWREYQEIFRHVPKRLPSRPSYHHLVLPGQKARAFQQSARPWVRRLCPPA
jgi:hypothetical protein